MRQVAKSFFNFIFLNLKFAKLGEWGPWVMFGEWTRVEVGEVGKYFRACQSSTC